ncbi:MAG: HAMP domain-containing protein [Actinobacteria bacterium]|nr:HAMP domain-containing protein [Actinomycetota bacterium]MSW40818.1 HAMP domain-containing protein [Actinomycetota bacterium]
MRLRTRLTLTYSAALFTVLWCVTAFMGYVLASTGLLDRLSLESAVQSLPFDSVLSNATGGLTLPLGGNVFTGKQLVRLAVLYGVISVVMGWWVARRTVRPITRITESIQHIADASIRERINFEGPSDEIKSLADTFDTMLDRIESAQSGQRRFVANAAHELRTPLTVQRAILEVRRANPDTSTDAHELIDELLAATTRTEALVESLLALAQGEQPPELTETVDLAASARLCLNSLAHISPASLTMTDMLRTAPTEGDPAMLDRAVSNLIENAMRHNREGGWVHVSTSVVGDGARRTSRLVVQNSGPLVDENDVASLFEPFRRGHARIGRGTGLGLSIVRAVATSHHGVVEAQVRTQGGLRVTLDLPFSPHSDEVASN